MGQNTLGQTDFRIFKTNISLEQSDEIALFFECWCKFTKITSWVKNFGVFEVKKGCGYSAPRTCGYSAPEILAVSQEIDGIIWFFAW